MVYNDRFRNHENVPFFNLISYAIHYLFHVNKNVDAPFQFLHVHSLAFITDHGARNNSIIHSRSTLWLNFPAFSRYFFLYLRHIYFKLVVDLMSARIKFRGPLDIFYDWKRNDEILFVYSNSMDCTLGADSVADSFIVSYFETIFAYMFKHTFVNYVIVYDFVK